MKLDYKESSIKGLIVEEERIRKEGVCGCWRYEGGSAVSSVEMRVAWK